MFIIDCMIGGKLLDSTPECTYMFSSFERSELDGNYAPSVSCLSVCTSGYKLFPGLLPVIDGDRRGSGSTLKRGAEAARWSGSDAVGAGGGLPETLQI